MINGEKILRKKYPIFDDDQYQPAGIDLKLGKVMSFNNEGKTVYAIVDNVKELPEQEEVEQSALKVGATQLEIGYSLEPFKPYIAVVDRPIDIDKSCAQFYLPRSSLLRGGIDVRTALGDPGFHGTLAFLIINHNDKPFFLKKGERFAQMVEFAVDGVINEYDGDYNE